MKLRIVEDDLRAAARRASDAELREEYARSLGYIDASHPLLRLAARTTVRVLGDEAIERYRRSAR